MSRFFINRPIVAMVIAILMTIVGIVVDAVAADRAASRTSRPPEIQVAATYPGADALTVEQSVATPIEQQMSGVDDMNYMYSMNANNGTMTLRVDFDVTTDAEHRSDPVADAVLAGAVAAPAGRASSTASPSSRRTTSPLALFSLYSPKGTYDALVPRELRLHQPERPDDARTGHRTGDDLRRRPVRDALLGAARHARQARTSRSPRSSTAIDKQNTVNPAGQIGGEPVPPGQEFTYTVRAQGRLVTPEEFGDIVVRANPDGSIVRMRTSARIELGAQNYNRKGRFNGKPAAIVAIYQLPGSNAIDTVRTGQGADGRSQGAASRPTSTTSSRSTPRSPSPRASGRS